MYFFLNIPYRANIALAIKINGIVMLKKTDIMPKSINVLKTPSTKTSIITIGSLFRILRMSFIKKNYSNLL
ncbi:hypothetical protein GCM10022292_18950 [Winogradskyella damuponensis]|uniref:Uncharacterized protein n=1 Tax=Winogradskyella damuponensis TaxID=943939 RepID=A0ABP8CUN5_9FLAO